MEVKLDIMPSSKMSMAGRSYENDTRRGEAGTKPFSGNVEF